MPDEPEEDDRLFRHLRGPFAGTPGQIDAVYWQTPLPIVERMLDLAQVGPGDTLIDLGSGDGRVVVAAARRGARAIGVDVDPERIADGERAVREAGVGALASFRQEDFFATRLDEASVVTLYLAAHLNRMLAPRLQTEPRPGARIVSYAFPVGDWKPDITELTDYVPLSLWTVPPR
jgi:SAM-dependent methyltransferase